MSAPAKQRARVVYLTYGDSPSGVYLSQVIDTCAFLSAEYGVAVRLVVFVSPRVWRSARTTIRKHAPDAWVLPALPRVASWRASAVVFSLLCTLLRPVAVIARSVPAANIAIRARALGLVRSVCLDGRGAVAAERREYLETKEPQRSRFATLERDAVVQSDCQIAVTDALRRYWADEYGHTADRSVVIPCTLAGNWLEPLAQDDRQQRDCLGYAPNDVVIVYAGSTAGWQSLATACEFVHTVLDARADVRFLFLSAPSAALASLQHDFPDRVQRMLVPPEDVRRILAACDYGLLLREPSVTNRVASPTKLAEYLAAGLPVILSDGIGEYSAFIRDHHAGLIADHVDVDALRPTDEETRRRLNQLAATQLSKPAYRREYAAVLEWLLGRGPGRY